MAAETNTIMNADLAKVMEVDFVARFTDNINKLNEALGTTRRIQKTAGQIIKVYKATGTLESGAVGEGEDIPLSKYQTTVAATVEPTLNKWRKQTTAEAIVEKGYKQAVNDTDDKMLRDIQKKIRTDFFAFLKTGTGTATGTSLQATLANAWGALSVAFEDTDAEPVYFVNPLDIADYLGKAQVSMQTAFGFSYIENFLGLGTVIVNSSVDEGKIIATAKENVCQYYIPAGGADLGNAFQFTSDATGLVGVSHDSNYKNMTSETVAISGIAYYPEFLDRIIIGTISAG